LATEIVLTGGQAFSTHEATRSDPFTVAEHLVASKVLPGTSLALHAVTTFPTLLMQWNPDFDIALCRSRKPKKLNIVQMPSFVAGNVFQVFPSLGLGKWRDFFSILMLLRMFAASKARSDP
jgi:hypothetical protein